MQTKELFEGLPYAVLGLGDTNYDKFCYMGKSIDKRLGELGGKRMMAVACADEATGFEETIEGWKKAVLAAVKTVHSEAVAQSKAATAATEPVDEEKIGEEMRQLQLEQVTVNIDASSASSSATPVPNQHTPTPSTPCENTAAQLLMHLPEHILTAHYIAQTLGINERVTLAPAAKDLPRLKACTEQDSPYSFATPGSASPAPLVDNVPAILPYRDSTASLHSKARSGSEPSLPDGSLWTADNPFLATVSGARWLTTKPPGTCDSEWGSWRRVIHLELSLVGSGIQYAPGDSIAICCPNAPYAVDIVLQRLQAAHPELSLSLDTLVAHTKKDKGTGIVQSTHITLQELLSYKFDLMGTPKKAVLMTLSQCCSDPQDAHLLQHLCSKSEDGKKLWTTCVEEQRIGVAELLVLFPSCTPRLHQLIACLTPLPPRYYSISSSPLACSDHLSIAFSIVRYASHANLGGTCTQSIRRAGLCTTYLQNLLFPILCKDAAPDAIHTTPEIRIRMFHKENVKFHLPGSVAPPLILIGPGTGVAPFMGFLEHRQQLSRERQRSAGSEDCCMGMWRGGFELEEEDLPVECNSKVEAFIHSVEPGPVYLFFGCRDDHDYLYRHELQDYLISHTLTELDVAQSRKQAEKVYVTHKLRARAAEIARLVLHENAHIYICGDGNHMAKDVKCAFKAILSAHAGLTDEETEAMLEDMKSRRRYNADIWS
jgi:methionine synthase reductase